MRLLNICLLVIALCLSTSNIFGQNKGKLFIIGGGDRSQELLSDLVSTADLRPNDYIVVLPMATSIPEESVAYISEQISAFAKQKIVSFNFDKEQANQKIAWIDSVKNARLIFITGGDQNKFMDVVRGSKLYHALHEAYGNGATISGTSAGAAVMSQIMITGGQKGNMKSESFREIKTDYVEVASGMGFMKNIIIDQHFIIRSRYNRLISLFADYSDKMVIGIDEGTALVVSGNKARVSGDSQIIVLEKPKNKKVFSNGKVSFQDIRLSIYAHGQEFKLRN